MVLHRAGRKHIPKVRETKISGSVPGLNRPRLSRSESGPGPIVGPYASRVIPASCMRSQKLILESCGCAKAPHLTRVVRATETTAWDSNELHLTFHAPTFPSSSKVAQHQSECVVSFPFTFCMQSLNTSCYSCD